MEEKKIEFNEFNGVKIDESIFSQGFVAGCDMKLCFGQCCSSGVIMDRDFKDVIMPYENDIIESMTADQPKDSEGWFDNNIEVDKDFESGYSIGTNTYIDRNGVEKCVFNDENHYCTLQVVAMKKGMHKWAIKPTHCILYPVTIVDNTLMYDDVHSLDMDYCGKHKTENFTQTVFDGVQEELRYVLGEDFFNFLNEIYKKNYSQKFTIQINQV